MVRISQWPQENSFADEHHASSIFHGLPDHEKEEAIKNIRHFQFTPAETLWQEGLYNPGLYIICQGAATIRVRNLEGRQRAVALFSPGNILYHTRIQHPGAHSAYMESLGHGCLGFIPLPEMRELLSTYPHLWLDFMDQIMERQIALMHELGASTYYDVQSKVARALLKLDEMGFIEERYCSQKLIADITGVRRESISRTLHQLEALGVLKVCGTDIEILEKDKLNTLSVSF